MEVAVGDEGDRAAPQQLHAPPTLPQEGPPARERLAFAFVSQCNSMMTPVILPAAGEGKEVRARELEPKQHAAFVLACERLGRYFAADRLGKN